MTELSAGTRICGHLQILQALPPTYGTPVLPGTVVARDEDSGTKYWLTVVEGRFLPNSIALSRFMANANALTVLRHPDLVRISLVDREETFCVVGSELLPAAHVWSEPSPTVRKVSTFDTAVAFARGLAHLHQRGILHGLFCSGNAVRWERNSLIWQYGIAGLLDNAALGAACRTSLVADVLAPELHAGEVVPATDVFHWGQTVAELLTGVLGLEARVRLDEDFPPPGSPLLRLVRRCLARDPRSRPRDALAVLEELESLGQDRREGTDARRGPPPTPSRRGPPPPPAPSASQSRGGLELDSLALATLDGEDDPVPQLAFGDDEAPPKPEAPEPPAEADLEGSQPLAIESKVDMPIVAAVLPGQTPFRVPRRSGPHGPAGIGPALALAVVAPLTVLAAAWPVFGLSQRVEHVADDARGHGSDEMTAADAVPASNPVSPPPPMPSSEPTPTADSPSGAVRPTRDDGCPSRMVAVDERTCIDIAEYPGRGRLPRVDVTYDQATAACAARSAQLCTLAQWRRACGGPGDNAYPYGPTPVVDRCNTASLAGFANDTVPAASRSDCVTGAGAFDLVGNVGEWVDGGRVVGGDASTPLAEAACDAQASPPVGFAGARVGFRCCSMR